MNINREVKKCEEQRQGIEEYMNAILIMIEEIEEGEGEVVEERYMRVLRDAKRSDGIN